MEFIDIAMYALLAVSVAVLGVAVFLNVKFAPPELQDDERTEDSVSDSVC